MKYHVRPNKKPGDYELRVELVRERQSYYSAPSIVTKRGDTATAVANVRKSLVAMYGEQLALFPAQVKPGEEKN